MEKTELEKKLTDAEKDINKIDNVVRSDYNMQQHANGLFNKLNTNADYKKFIIMLKAGKGMNGNIPFEKLSVDNKKDVFMMIKEAIQLFIVETIKNIG